MNTKFCFDTKTLFEHSLFICLESEVHTVFANPGIEPRLGGALPRHAEQLQHHRGDLRCTLWLVTRTLIWNFEFSGNIDSLAYNMCVPAQVCATCQLQLYSAMPQPSATASGFACCAQSRPLAFCRNRSFKAFGKYDFPIFSNSYDILRGNWVEIRLKL